jgi:hypothetical protein
MSVDIFNAIIELCGFVNFSIDGNDYDSIVWYDENKQKPTKEEIEQKIKEMEKALPLNRLRLERDEKLSETDRYGLVDYKFSNDLEKESWMKYRQELRDLPEKYKDIVLLDSETNQLVNVVWPTPPDKM